MSQAYYRAKDALVYAEQFAGDGRVMALVEQQYLGSDDSGLPLFQGNLQFKGGVATLYRGDWLVEGRWIYTDAEFQARYEPVVLTTDFAQEAAVADAPATADSHDVIGSAQEGTPNSDVGTQAAEPTEAATSPAQPTTDATDEATVAAPTSAALEVDDYSSL